jgi:UPF0755 protein
LYGDGGWDGQQAQEGQQVPYGGQPQQPEEQQRPQQPQYGNWGHGQQADHGQAQQHHQQYGWQSHQSYEGHGHQAYDGQNHQSHQTYGGQNHQAYDGQNHQSHGDQGRQHADHQQQYQGGGWDTGTQTCGQVPYHADPADPYGGRNPRSGGEQSDYHDTSDRYPPPEPPARRTEPEPQPTDWDPGPDQGEHAFFADVHHDEDNGNSEDTARRGGRKSKAGKGGKKGRSGLAWLAVVLVFGGGISGAGYFGQQFYQGSFGAAPDYEGEGTSETVTVTIPRGALGSAIGRELKKAGVVRSVDAFVAAQRENANGDGIQAGVYVLNKRMSAKSAVELMLNPMSRNANNLVVAEGRRTSQIYELIDKRLELKKGTTASVAKKEWADLGLPDWAGDNKDIKDPLEGFLFPSSYPVSKEMKPEEVLKEMVDFSKAKYELFGLADKAKLHDLDSPLQLITVASLVQAEGKTNDDFRKMAEVVYNRLKPTNAETYQLLQFDSTFNYLKGESNIDISESEINSNQDPYNTYTQKGLPPGPICNPGDEALQAALKPTDEGWIYFVSTDGVEKTEFARTHSEFLKLKEKFNASSGS